MRGSAEEEIRQRLRFALGRESSLLPIACAVVSQLASGNSDYGLEATVDRVTQVIVAARAGDPVALELLTNDPPLLSSFFQNADLLEGEDPQTKALTEAIMSAFAEVWEGSE